LTGAHDTPLFGCGETRIGGGRESYLPRSTQLRFRRGRAATALEPERGHRRGIEERQLFGYFDDPVPDRTHVETGSTEGIGGQDPPPGG
jgi:hypothetical protein